MEFKNLISNKKLLIGTGIIIIIPLLVISIIYFLPTSKDKRSLNSILLKLENYNHSLYSCIKNDSIDYEKAESLLNSGIENLDNLLNELSDISVTNENSSTKSKLYETIDCNKQIFSLALSLLKNPNDANLNSRFSEYSTKYKLLLENFKDLKKLGLKASFPNESKTFFEYSCSYVNTVIKLNREKDVKTTQKREYVINIQNLLAKFDEISENLEPALNKIKEDGRSLEVLLTDIKEKKSKFNEIKSISYSLSIPEEGNECFSLLQDTINYYDLYINSLEHSLIIEKSSDNDNNSKNKEYISKNYDNSFSKYKDFTDNLAELKSELNSFNNN